MLRLHRESCQTPMSGVKKRMSQLCTHYPLPQKAEEGRSGALEFNTSLEAAKPHLRETNNITPDIGVPYEITRNMKILESILSDFINHITMILIYNNLDKNQDTIQKTYAQRRQRSQINV